MIRTGGGVDTGKAINGGGTTEAFLIWGEGRGRVFNAKLVDTIEEGFAAGSTTFFKAL